MKKQTGIWLDLKEANIIDLIDEDELKVQRIHSGVDTTHAKGGSRTGGTPWGPMGKISENKVLNRRKHQEKGYFKEILEAVKTSDEILIFGPGEAKDGLISFIKDDDTRIHSRVRGVETADSMTVNQKIAYVRKFFS